MNEFLKEPYEVIEKKLALAEMTIELGQITREKWIQLERVREILSKEEDMIKKIAEASKALDTMARS